MHAIRTLLIPILACGLLAVTSVARAQAQAPTETRGAQDVEPSGTIPTLKKVGTRGFYVLTGTFAPFDPGHPSVEVWTPDGDRNAPVMVYAHGGAGFREDDRARVDMFRRAGFATISFDSYQMNGFDDWQFVTRKVANSGKQKMIWGVFRGAVAYARTGSRWDSRNIFFYGGSNGGRVVLYAGSELAVTGNEGIGGVRAIISEAPAATGFALGDYDIPTLIPFGKLDTWAGRSDTDYVWTRTYPNSPVSIADWVNARRGEDRPVDFIFYDDAGHLMFEGPLKKVTVRRGNAIAFTAYEGASEEALSRYKQDVIDFARKHLVP